MRRSSHILVAILALAGTLRSSASTPTEYEVKAAFLLNFARFVEWPGESRQGPIRLCIVGRDPFGASLDQIVGGRLVNGRAIEIYRGPSPAGLKRCHIVFVSNSENARLSQVLTELEGAPALTVSEIEGFAAKGGMIGLALDENRIRLEINIEPASRSQLKISSQLLRVAKLIGPPPRGRSR
jgi:hypothetical protein